MAASMWRMSGPCRRMAAVLVLCALMLSSEAAATNTTTTSNGTYTSQDLSTLSVIGASTAMTSPPTDTTPVNGQANTTPILTDPPAHRKEYVGEKVNGATASPPPSGSSVFVGILVSGLLAALAITLGYLKSQRRTDTKGVRLAEESHPVEQDNQGNTLVSVAPLNPPLNPPLETPEKPSENGEAPEADKTEPPSPPPTNGHSTTKTADTEM